MVKIGVNLGMPNTLVDVKEFFVYSYNLIIAQGANNKENLFTDRHYTVWNSNKESVISWI